jgi:hypothetical protein
MVPCYASARVLLLLWLMYASYPYAAGFESVLTMTEDRRRSFDVNNRQVDPLRRRSFDVNDQNEGRRISRSIAIKKPAPIQTNFDDDSPVSSPMASSPMDSPGKSCATIGSGRTG